jgi:hypothetical protein
MILPEQSFAATTKVQSGAGLEQLHVIRINGNRLPIPRSIWVSPIKPHPSQSQGLTEKLQVLDTKSTKSLRGANLPPIDKAFCSGGKFITSPEKNSSYFVYLFGKPSRWIKDCQEIGKGRGEHKIN